MIEAGSNKQYSLPVKSVGGPPSVAPRGSYRWIMTNLLLRFNRLRRSVATNKVGPRASCAALREIQEIASVPSDINEHLELIFAEALSLRPKLIVEMGVRGGTTTFVFEKVAALCQSAIVSIDLDDCSSVSKYNNWHFFRGDDVRFALDFPGFCRARAIPERVDLLYIDTSHFYDHTLAEMQAWFPLLSANAKVIFHDTNMRLLGPRKDGCFEVAWDNERGVTRAIENYLGIMIDETRDFTDYAKGWLVRHHPNCNGLTILQRIDEPINGQQ